MKIAQGNEYSPLTWKGLRTPEGRSASLTCKNGHTIALTNHDIGPYGVVTPSVVCPEAGCDFHENVVLEGWIE